MADLDQLVLELEQRLSTHMGLGELNHPLSWGYLHPPKTPKAHLLLVYSPLTAGQTKAR